MRVLSLSLAVALSAMTPAVAIDRSFQTAVENSLRGSVPGDWFLRASCCLYSQPMPAPRGVKDSHSFTFLLCTLSRGVVLQSWFALYRRASIKNQIPGAILHA